MRSPAVSSRRAALAIAACFAGIFALTIGSGCSKKTTESTYDEAGTGMGESDLGGSGSSLDQFRRGTLGSGGYGPLDDIFFGYDSTSLSEEARETLNQNAEWLRANPAARVELEGHCDNRAPGARPRRATTW
jgi:peptidoglycan-associated lipoprotein